MPVPITLTIPLPTQIKYGKGIESTTGPNGCLIQCRGTTPERDKIQYAAGLIGLSYGSFMRRAVNDAADALIKAMQIDNTVEQ